MRVLLQNVLFLEGSVLGCACCCITVQNKTVLANLHAVCSTRAFHTVPPQELTDAAHKAARLTDTDAHIQTASRSYTRALWYQSRVWDPDD